MGKNVIFQKQDSEKLNERLFRQFMDIENLKQTIKMKYFSS